MSLEYRENRRKQKDIAGLFLHLEFTRNHRQYFVVTALIHSGAVSLKLRNPAQRSAVSRLIKWRIRFVKSE